MPEHGRRQLSQALPPAGLFLAALGLASAAGCGSRGAYSPPLNPAQIAAQAIADLDTNRSGVLEAAEIAAAHGLRSGLAKIDADKNGIITAAEIEQRIAQYGQFPIDSLPLGCVVCLDGQPLAEGQVRLVPEPFFGPARQVVSGRSDGHGIVDFRVGGEGACGVPQGMYRIEVTKPDAAGNETLPARYNKQSQLGQEIAFDRREIEGSLRLELTSR